MSIIFFSVGEAGQVGETPRRIKLVSSDNYAVLTQPGYLNQSTTSGKQIYPTDIIDVLYSYTGTSNFNIASAFGTGTYQQFIPVFNNGIITLQSISQITTTTTLTQAQVQGMYAAPVSLIPAAGAGTVIVVQHGTIYTNFNTAAFQNGGATIIQYDSTIHGGGSVNALSATVAASNINASSSQIYNVIGNRGNALTGISNKGIYISNQTGAFTNGSAASTVVITLTYDIIAATI